MNYLINRILIRPNNFGCFNLNSVVKVPVREACGRGKKKFKGIVIQDGAYVQKGTTLVLQNFLNFFPGLNVGFGRNGTLFAMVPGTVRVTSEKPNLKMDHSWVAREFGGRNVENLYKKYFNVIPDKEHNRFKLIDKI